MELTVYTITLAVAAVITAIVTALARTGGGTKTPATRDFRTFQYGYLLIYYIAMTADWLQGPYVYALYSSYGFSKHDIAVLFVGGFGSSMVFGTFAGAAADRLGRKRACQLYCVLYILSCATKHAHDYNILMIGRITGGIATSLLFSAFESWMVCEHNARGYDGGSLSDTFSLMYFGNSLCAIGAGMLAEAGADAVALTPFAGQRKWHYGGYCTPFDFSAAFLVVGLVLITCLWGENYGSSPSSSGGRSDCMSSFKGPLAMLFTDKRLVLCGLVVSLFEGSMYIFVFNWCAPPPAQFGAIPRSSAQFAAQFGAIRRAPRRTPPTPHPTLSRSLRTPAFSAGAETTPPFGLIFATFMVACMGGSSFFALVSGRISYEALLRNAFVVAAAALSLPLYSSQTVALLISFLAFEAVVGVYWPAIGTIKSRVVPEEARATIYNLYRVPLNCVVLGVLLNDLAITTAFGACCAMLLVAAVAMHVLSSAPAKHTKPMSGGDGADSENGLLEDGRH